MGTTTPDRFGGPGGVLADAGTGGACHGGGPPEASSGGGPAGTVTGSVGSFVGSFVGSSLIVVPPVRGDTMPSESERPLREPRATAS